MSISAALISSVKWAIYEDSFHNLNINISWYVLQLVPQVSMLFIIINFIEQCEVLHHRVELKSVSYDLSWKKHVSINGDVYSQLLYVHSSTQQGDSGLPHRPTTGQSDWAGLLGKFPFVGNKFIWKEDVCLGTSVCVCVCARLWGKCMTLLDLYGLRSDLEHHFAWKTEGDTHTHTLVLVPACAVGVWTPPKKIVRPHNCWQSLCYCLHAHCGQPDNQLYSASLPSPLKHLIWVFLPADWGFQIHQKPRCHPQVHPEIITWQWHRPLFPFSGLPLKCILPPRQTRALLTHTPFKKHEHTNTNTPFL